LDEPANVSSVLVGTMQKLDSWIFPAKRFEIFIPEDGDEYFKVAEQQPELDRNIYSVVVNDFEMNFEPRNARYVKIIARSFREIPGWHSGKGNPAWMFIDELIVN
jgi:hexosaminidase